MIELLVILMLKGFYFFIFLFFYYYFVKCITVWSSMQLHQWSRQFLLSIIPALGSRCFFMNSFQQMLI